MGGEPGVRSRQQANSAAFIPLLPARRASHFVLSISSKSSSKCAKKKGTSAGVVRLHTQQLDQGEIARLRGVYQGHITRRQATATRMNGREQRSDR